MVDLEATTNLVSIHAPAWGATLLILKVRLPALVSIHAPAWGATYKEIMALGQAEGFNPRSRMGSDTNIIR